MISRDVRSAIYVDPTTSSNALVLGMPSGLVSYVYDPADPAPTLGWEVIAAGNDGPGLRSRHGLVYDRSAKAAVLFAGIIWDAMKRCQINL